MYGELLILCGILFAVAFLLTVLSMRRLLPFLQKKKAGQPILVIGPSWHLPKSGTPTLGGLAFILGISLPAAFLGCCTLWRGQGEPRMLLLVLFALAMGAIGLADDMQKLSKKQNKGLSAAQKYFLQLLVSASLLYATEVLLAPSHDVMLPFSGKLLSLGWLYYPLALLYLTGIVNALNLTDGVDGLLGTLVAVFAGVLILAGFLVGMEDAAPLGALLLGGAIGFLCYNRHPAKVFMGDTGSLYLGALVAGFGLLSDAALAILIAGGVFVLEAASVCLQVVWFKLSGGKRIFRMAPLHHHFEKGGWSEERVVACFSLIAVIFGALALFVLW